MEKLKIQIKNLIKKPIEISREKNQQDALKLYQAVRPRVTQRIRTLRSHNSNSNPQEIL